MSIGKRIVLFLLTAVLITVFILYFGQTLLEVLTPILLAAIQAYLFLPFIKTNQSQRGDYSGICHSYGGKYCCACYFGSCIRRTDQSIFYRGAAVYRKY